MHPGCFLEAEYYDLNYYFSLNSSPSFIESLNQKEEKSFSGTLVAVGYCWSLKFGSLTEML